MAEIQIVAASDKFAVEQAVAAVEQFLAQGSAAAG
jgi:hypothetical protein